MRLIPSISPEASVSGQGKQGMTPSGAHQCCSASPFLQAGGGSWFEAGPVQHQESPRIISGSSHLLGLSLWSPHGCCRELGAGAAPKALSTTCAKAAGRAGVVSQVTQLRVAALAIQGCCSSMFLLKDVLGKECLSLVLADKLLYWQQYFFAFGNTLGMARKRGGAGFRGGVSAGAVSPWSLFLPGAAPERAHPCPALPSSGKSRHCSRLGSRRASGECFVAAAFYSDHSTAGMAAATWDGIVGCVIFHRPLSVDAFAEGTVDGVKVVQIPESDHSVNPGQNVRPKEGVGCRLVRVADEKRRLLKVTFVPDSIPGTGSGSLTQITLVYSSVFTVSYILSECAPHTNIYVCYQRDVRASAETDGD